METKIEFKDAFDVFTKTLKEDSALYYAYQSNIAVQFQDAITRAGYRFPDLHRLSNEAAMNFLDLLLAKTEEGNA